EEGMRDWSVTGVQTCALPIFNAPPPGAGRLDPAPIALGAAAAPALSAASSDKTLELSHFYGSLRELEQGRRSEHVRVLWLGDSGSGERSVGGEWGGGGGGRRV